jgi:N utilization substance protein B
MTEIVDVAEAKMDFGKQKYIPTQEELNPNTKFIQNKLVEEIRINKALKSYLLNSKLTWTQYPEFVRNLFVIIKESKEYQDYMQNPESSFEIDRNFILWIYTEIIPNHEPLLQILEEQSIYWNDDIEFVISMIIKTLTPFKYGSDGENKLMPLYKNQDDMDFIKNLYRRTVLNHAEYRALIEQYSKNWDIERIAYIDILIIQLAIAEIIEFPTIPVKVSFNEYIEIAKYYCTPKSSNFINGVLDKIVVHLKTENKLNKSGRGLIE